jgi:poly(3-hydroxybutyrate) depolymerase
LLIAGALVLAATATAALLPGRQARAVPGSGHAPVGANWGQHLRPTPNVTPAALPPMSAGLQPVPLPDGRTVLLHLPPRSNLVHPLIFALHGLANTYVSVEKDSGFDALADRQGYIIAYGVGVGRSWDAGSCCGSAVTQRVDDVDYLAEAVNAISAHFAVDQARIVVTGFSNGGMMAFRAACERPGLFRAALTVSGPLVAACPNPVTVTHVHGTLDTTVPLTGGYSAYTHSSFGDSRTEASRLPRGSHERLVLWRGGHHWPTPSYGVDVDQLLIQLVG